MSLAMSRPWKHPKSGVYWVRKRVPDDLLKLVGKREEKRSLQPHARDEHRRYQTAPRRDPGLRSVYCCARRVTVQVAQHSSRLRPD